MSIRAINWAVEVSIRIGIPSAKRLTLLLIAKHHHDKTGLCFPSYDTLAIEAGCTRRKVIFDVQDFEFNGLLIRQKRRVNGQQGSNNLVLFGRPKFTKWATTRVKGGTPCKSERGFTQNRVNGGSPYRDWLYTIEGGAADKPVVPAKDKIANVGGGGAA